MKTANRHRSLRAYPARPPYPNAADRSYFIHRLADIATALLSAAGLTASIICMAAWL